MFIIAAGFLCLVNAQLAATATQPSDGFARIHDKPIHF